MFFKTQQSGFSLAEILIALGIIALISIFAIPKFRTTADTKMQKENMKAAVAEVSAALLKYKQNKNIINGTTGIEIFEDSLNYIRLDTSSTIDGSPCEGTVPCSNFQNCFYLSNGAAVHIRSAAAFNGFTDHHAVKFKIDPDGVVTGGSGDAGEAVPLYLYYDGKIRSREQILDDTIVSTGPPESANPSCVPDWWSWD